jgi:hypothetical protein
MAGLSKVSTLSCGCPATWDEETEQYVGECHCPPERQRDRWLAQEHARIASIEASERRSNAPLYRKPFSILR